MMRRRFRAQPESEPARLTGDPMQRLTITERLLLVALLPALGLLLRQIFGPAEPSARRANLTGMAAEIEAATERGLKTVVDGSAVLTRKTEEMRGALEAIHAASDQAAKAADHSRAINADATRLSDAVIVAIDGIATKVQEGSEISRGAVERAANSRATIGALAKAAKDIGEIVGVI